MHTRYVRVFYLSSCIRIFIQIRTRIIMVVFWSWMEIYLVVFLIRNRNLDKRMFPKVKVVHHSAEENIWLAAVIKHLSVGFKSFMDIWYKASGWLPAFWVNIMHTKWSKSLWLISKSFCGLTQPSWFPHSLSTTGFWNEPGLTALDSSQTQLRTTSQRRSLEHPDTLNIDKVQLLL